MRSDNISQQGYFDTGLQARKGVQKFKYLEENSDDSNELYVYQPLSTLQTVIYSVLGIILVAFLIAGSVLGVISIFNMNHTEYLPTYIAPDDLQSLYSNPDYINGEEASSEEYIAVNKFLTRYFHVYAGGQGFDKLDKYVVDGSAVSKASSKYRDSSKYAYDKNDCYYRGMKFFGTYIQLNKVNKVLVKDNQYYVYCWVNVPYKEGLGDYYNKNAADLVLFFNKNSKSMSNLTKFIVKSLSTTTIPCVEREYLFKLDKDSLKLIDDSAMVDLLVEPYEESMNIVSNVLSGKLMN